MSILLAKHLIDVNYTLVINSAIKDCHCLGLYSFIINQSPKIRLFIADENCELRNNYNIENPLIPIHAHKYDDVFLQVHGILIHHIYQEGNGFYFPINKYTYSRLSDDISINNLGKVNLEYLGSEQELKELSAKCLHSVSISSKGRCSWMIIEGKEDKSFEQVCYHRDLKFRKELYKPFPNAIEYLNNYFK